MTLKEFVQRAKNENGRLEVKFVKVTNDEERTAVLATTADVGFTFDDSVTVSPRTLKTIAANHGRVYSQNVTYTGSLLTFPELVTADTPNVSSRLNDLPDGSGQWQWRRLYVQQILELKYNGTVVWQNNDLFNFSLVGEAGQKLTTVSQEEYEKMRQEIIARDIERTKTLAAQKIKHKKAVALAKTLTAADCAKDIGCINGWGSDPEDVYNKKIAISIKHDWLRRTDPEHHIMSSYEPYRCYTVYTCSCGYTWSADSSD